MTPPKPLQHGPTPLYSTVPVPEALPVLNLRAALDRLGGDADLAREIAQIVVEDADALLADIDNALRANHAERVALAAHSLKGLVSNFNAEACAAAAKTVEQAGRARELEGAERLLETLRWEVQRLLTALREEVLG